MDDRRSGAHRVPAPPPRTTPLIDRLSRIRTRTLLLFALAAFLLVLALWGLSLAGDRTGGGEPAPSAAGTSAVDTPPPVPDVKGSPQPGPKPVSMPAAAQVSSPYGINAQALLEEMRKHDPNIPDADVVKLVAIGDMNVARNEPDLASDDPQIRGQIDAAFPNSTAVQRATMTRCTAEYVERQIALNNHTTPPDSTDDHGGG